MRSLELPVSAVAFWAVGLDLEESMDKAVVKVMMVTNDSRNVGDRMIAADPWTVGSWLLMRGMCVAAIGLLCRYCASCIYSEAKCSLGIDDSISDPATIPSAASHGLRRPWRKA